MWGVVGSAMILNSRKNNFAVMSLIITIMVLECEYCITWNSVQCKLNGIDSCFKGTLFLKLFLLSFYFLFKVLTRLSVVWDQRRCHNTKSCKLSCNDIKCPSLVRTQKYDVHNRDWHTYFFIDLHSFWGDPVWSINWLFLCKVWN